ncbi:hypothetical protein D1007_22171 [Hordeum vulgare]|nr:hypothetical protein D1007_22171 [Hordeum vulgare]
MHPRHQACTHASMHSHACTPPRSLFSFSPPRPNLLSLPYFSPPSPSLILSSFLFPTSLPLFPFFFKTAASSQLPLFSLDFLPPRALSSFLLSPPSLSFPTGTVISFFYSPSPSIAATSPRPI